MLELVFDWPTRWIEPRFVSGIGRIMDKYRPMERSFYALYSSRKQMPAGLRALLDFLALRFPAEPDWDSDLRA